MAHVRKLTLLQVNDVHGYLEPHPELFWAGNEAEYRMAGGYGRLAALLGTARRQNPGGVLAFDCGDTIHGTHAAVQSEGQALVPILNELDFDAWTAHWEFAYGPRRLQEVSGQLCYPLLAVNCYDQHTHELVFQPYTVVEAARLRVGVVGIAATIVDKVMPPSFSEGVYLTLGREELPQYIRKLRDEERVDLVVVISHLGFPQEYQLAGEVDGIDVLLSSHTHNRLYAPVVRNSTILIQSGCHGSFLGRLDLTVELNRRGGASVTDMSHELVVVRSEIEPDPAVQALVAEARATHEARELGEVVGETATGLNRYTSLEATMDNLLLQSLLDLTGAQMAFSNGWRYGAPVPPGPVTMDDLWNIIPVNPPVSTCKLSGEELWAMMEENLERTFARNPYEQMGGYVKRCLGLNLYFKAENPEGQRIQELFVQDERVRGDRLYDVAFVTSQGVPAKYGTDRQNLDTRAIEAMRRYLENAGRVDAGLRGTVVAV